MSIVYTAETAQQTLSNLCAKHRVQIERFKFKNYNSFGVVLKGFKEDYEKLFNSLQQVNLRMQEKYEVAEMSRNRPVYRYDNVIFFETK